MIEQITHSDLHLATIIRTGHNETGIHFFTDDDAPLQVGYMNREKSYTIQPHVHNPVERIVMNTHEVLFIKTGKVRVDFYTQEKQYIRSTVLNKGDVVLLADGGHGFKMLESSEIIEVKQGPYVGERDKVRFESIEDDLVNNSNIG